jgi:hypothetical protein
MKDTLAVLTDSVKRVADVVVNDPVGGVEGIERSRTIGYSSWITINILLVTAVLFVIIYRERQYLAFKTREYFSSDNRFFSTQSFSGTNKVGVMAVLLIIMANSIGLIVSGIANLYPHLFNLLAENSVYSSSGLFLTMKVCGMVLLFVIFKAVIYALVNWLFFRREQNMKWMQSYFFINSSFAFLFFPFALMLLFVGISEKILSFSLVILFISYEILLLYKLITNFKANKYGILLIFLYFCTVELLPALFVWKNIH